jgi:hypothetical protein
MSKSNRTPRPARTLHVENLERRDLMAGISRWGEMLILSGDNWNNHAKVEYRGGALYAEIASSPNSGTSTKPVVVSRTFPLGQIRQVKFDGGNGDDSFVNQTGIGSVANGGSGNDWLKGGTGDDTLAGDVGNDHLDGNSGNDTLSGGADHDRIFGGLGDDNLYGDDGNDQLSGGAGCDGLYGGRGTDRLEGGADADRFLLGQGSSTSITDRAANDAVLSFDAREKGWDPGEIRMVDQGLRMLHLRTRNSTLLKGSDGQPLAFLRANKYGDRLASNDTRNHSIIMYDAAFESTMPPQPLSSYELEAPLTCFLDKAIRRRSRSTSKTLTRTTSPTETTSLGSWTNWLASCEMWIRPSW